MPRQKKHGTCIWMKYVDPMYFKINFVSSKFRLITWKRKVN